MLGQHPEDEGEEIGDQIVSESLALLSPEWHESDFSDSSDESSIFPLFVRNNWKNNCGYCGDSFVRKSTLRQHIDVHHKGLWERQQMKKLSHIETSQNSIDNLPESQVNLPNEIQVMKMMVIMMY